MSRGPDGRLIEAASALDGRLPGVIYVADATDWGRTVYVSSAIEALLGYAASEWTQDPRMFKAHLHPADEARVVAAAAQSLDTGEPFRCEYRLRASDGRHVWFRDEAIITRDEDGARWRQGVLLALGGQPDLEAQIVRRLLQEMVETNELLMVGERNLAGTLQAVAERARAVTGADFAAISIFDPEGRVERFVYAGIDERTAQAIGNPPLGRGLLGDLRQGRAPIRSSDLKEHLAFTGFPPHHPDMAAFLGVPIHSDGRTLGSLYMTRLRGRAPFSDGDELSAALLALHVAVHVKDALGSEQSERMALLAERGRIAHDLHDGTIQVLYAMGLESEAITLRDDLPGDVRELLGEHVTRINQLIGDIREYIKMLEAKAPEGPPELSRDLAYVARQMVPASISTILNIRAAALQEIDARDAEDVLFIAREALSNAVRHGSPGKVAIDVRQTPTDTALTIQDDGIGFDASGARVGLGTVTMRTRAERLGADLTVISIPGMGTTVRLRVPRKANEGEP